MRILVSYRGAPRIRGWETGAMVARAFRRLGHDVSEYAKVYERGEWVEPCANTGESYDLHVYMEMNDSEPQYLELSGIDADQRVAWFFDVSYNPPFYKQLADAMEFDWVFSANPLYGVNHFGRSCSFLPYAADPELHFREISGSYAATAALVGTERPERRRLIDAVDRLAGGALLISDVFKEDYVNALAASSITINENPPAGRGLLNMRTFEAPAAGSILLCQEGDYIDRCLTPGIDVLTYRDAAELVGQCQNVQQNPQDFEDMRRRCQERVMEDHTYDCRAQEILDLLGL